MKDCLMQGTLMEQRLDVFSTGLAMYLIFEMTNHITDTITQ